MAHLTHQQYEQLERAVADGRRIAVHRRGTEYVLVPSRLAIRDGREAIEASNPTTGDHLTIYLDELDAFEVVR